jgi:hypothetical protein
VFHNKAETLKRFDRTLRQSVHAVFDTSGNLIQRLISNGNLNSPWGLALLADLFHKASRAILSFIAETATR